MTYYIHAGLRIISSSSTSIGKHSVQPLRVASIFNQDCAVSRLPSLSIDDFQDFQYIMAFINGPQMCWNCKNCSDMSWNDSGRMQMWMLMICVKGYKGGRPDDDRQVICPSIGVKEDHLFAKLFMTQEITHIYKDLRVRSGMQLLIPPWGSVLNRLFYQQPISICTIKTVCILLSIACTVNFLE